MGTSLLINENPLILLPSLAKMIGLNEAIVLQQLHFYLSNPKAGVERDGERWIYNTYEQWQEEAFPFWSTDTIKRTFLKLQEMHIVEACQPDGRESRRKYYRLNRGMIPKLTFENVPAEFPEEGNLPPSKPDQGNLPRSEEGNLPRSCASASNYAETSTETSISAGVPKITAEQIYAAYPRKVARPKALEAIRKALKSMDGAKLLALTKEYAISRAGQDVSFTPYPQKWFNWERYNDDPSTWAKKKGSSI